MTEPETAAFKSKYQTSFPAVSGEKRAFPTFNDANDVSMPDGRQIRRFQSPNSGAGLHHQRTPPHPPPPPSGHRCNHPSLMSTLGAAPRRPGGFIELSGRAIQKRRSLPPLSAFTVRLTPHEMDCCSFLHPPPPPPAGPDSLQPSGSRGWSLQRFANDRLALN